MLPEFGPPKAPPSPAAWLAQHLILKAPTAGGGFTKDNFLFCRTWPSSAPGADACLQENALFPFSGQGSVLRVVILDHKGRKMFDVRDESWPQVEEFKHLRILFTSDNIMEQEMDQVLINSNEDAAPVCHSEERADPKSKAIDLLGNLHSNAV